MTWRNTQRRRSITLCHERVVIHVRYHKGQQQTGRYKDNIRFLAQPIGDLLLDYIVYVMPLRQIFLRQQSPKALLSPFLWEKNGKVWADGQLSRHLGEASARACVPRLHVSNWRQMTVAIVKTKFVSQISVFEANDQDEDAEEVDDNIRIMTRQRNHKTQTVNRAYANQIGAAYGNVWDGLIRMGLRASTLWQDFWGVEVTLKGQKRGRAKVESWLAKRVAMGVYRPRKPWSAEALLAGAKKLYGNGELGWTHDNHVMDGAGGGHTTHWRWEELALHAAVHASRCRSYSTCRATRFPSRRRTTAATRTSDRSHRMVIGRTEGVRFGFGDCGGRIDERFYDLRSGAYCPAET